MSFYLLVFSQAVSFSVHNLLPLFFLIFLLTLLFSVFIEKTVFTTDSSLDSCQYRYYARRETRRKKICLQLLQAVCVCIDQVKTGIVFVCDDHRYQVLTTVCCTLTNTQEWHTFAYRVQSVFVTY